VTGLAHYLKLMIRINLQGALRLERHILENQKSGHLDPDGDAEAGLRFFLDEVNSLDARLEEDASVDPATEEARYYPRAADTCPICQRPVEDTCFVRSRWVYHSPCLKCQQCGRDLSGDRAMDARFASLDQAAPMCSQCAPSIVNDDKLQRREKLATYVELLRVAHARLQANLRNNGSLPHTSGKNASSIKAGFANRSPSIEDDPNLAGYDSTQGHRVSTQDQGPPLLRTDVRSKSFAGQGAAEPQTQSSYEQTIGDIKRLRSTRLDKHLSTSMRRARSSRIIDGPEGIQPGSTGEEHPNSHAPKIIQEQEPLDEFDAAGLPVSKLALDDIPRIVAAEQAKEQRPNAYKYSGGNLIGHGPEPKLLNGHRRGVSDEYTGSRPEDQAGLRPKVYFSELSALEYFIVRHIAVLSMEPLFEGQFNQEELLDLIETRKPATIWGKFGKAFKKSKPRSDKDKDKDKAIFGRSLESVVEKDGADSTDGIGPGTLRIPAFIQEVVCAMKSMDMAQEGVFRKNGNIKRLKDMAEEIDTKGVDAVDLTKENPIQLAALLKRYLRELPDPLLTYKLHDLFVAASREYKGMFT
jgi:hypothetical protein